MFVKKVLLFLLVSGVPTGLLALDSTPLHEALRQPVVDKRLNMTIGVLGNSDGRHVPLVEQEAGWHRGDD